MILGLGTGSTAEIFIHLLAEKIQQEQWDILAVPTSKRTQQLAESLQIPLTNLTNHPVLDCVIDGADECDSQKRLIKGGGGALLIEKIVASASKKMVVIADPSKKVEILGAFPLPVEIIPFGFGTIFAHLKSIYQNFSTNVQNAPVLREVHGQPFVTDSGNWIIDMPFGQISDPQALSDALNAVCGVVEHGLFLGLATDVVFGDETI
jgi:ribose 5-phosphate isomerase A